MSDQPGSSRLTLNIERAGTTAVVLCRGRLVIGTTDFLFLEVRQLIPVTKRIVLDLTELTFVDSMGIGTLVRLYVSARSAGCALELVNLAKQIRQLLGAVNLLSVFTIIGEHDIRVP